MNGLVEALNAAKRGWYVFPIKRNAKFPPLIKDWENQSSNDPDQIEQWAAMHPNCNWGLACGRSDIIVVDVDVKDGKGGLESLRVLEIENGRIPDSGLVFTPSGGLHYYLAGKCRSGADVLGPGIDVKSVGGYVLLPGSAIDAGEYAWNQF